MKRHYKGVVTDIRWLDAARIGCTSTTYDVAVHNMIPDNKRRVYGDEIPLANLDEARWTVYRCNSTVFKGSPYYENEQGNRIDRSLTREERMNYKQPYQGAACGRWV